MALKAAITKARELDLLLITKQFQWNRELLGKQSQRLDLADIHKSENVVGSWIEEYEQNLWKNCQGVRTWKSHYIRHLKTLDWDAPLSISIL